MPGKFLDLSGTGHSVAMAGALLAMYGCLGVRGIFTPNRTFNDSRTMRHSRLKMYILGITNVDLGV